MASVCYKPTDQAELMALAPGKPKFYNKK